MTAVSVAARPDRQTARKQLSQELRRLLSEYGRELAVGGDKTEILDPIDPQTGYWERPTYVTNKPPRWLVHLSLSGENVPRAHAPEGHGADRLAHYNTAARHVGGIVVRVLPVLERLVGESKVFEAYNDWEWALVFILAEPLPHGSAAQLVDDFHPEDVRLRYLGQEREYIAAGLFMLSDPQSTYHGWPSSVSYRDATTAVANLIQVRTQ